MPFAERDNVDLLVIRGQYTYLWGLLADSRRIVARGRGDREEPHLAVNFFCKLADP
jgi:hypothetical protein